MQVERDRIEIFLKGYRIKLTVPILANEFLAEVRHVNQEKVHACASKLSKTHSHPGRINFHISFFFFLEHLGT